MSSTQVAPPSANGAALSNQQVFSDTLLELAEQNASIWVVTSDSRGSGRLVAFGKRLPEQIIEVGIAEQNLVGIAAGIAATGKQVFAVSPACFLTARSLEQIKNDVAYSDRPVKLVGISAGVSYGTLGTTHHSLHDLAVLQAINNIDIVVPADNVETRGAVLAAVKHPRPLYIRLGKRAVTDLPSEEPFTLGEARTIRRGRDVTLIAIGETVAAAYAAALLLAEEGVDAGVLSMHTLRPFDEQAVLAAARRSHTLITVEEHSVYGGLGATVASLLMQSGLCRPLRIVGIPDEYTLTGSQSEIFNHYGISAEGLARTARSLLTTHPESAA